MLSFNNIWIKRLYEIGIVDREIVLYFGLSGLLVRASGILLDYRLFGYESYGLINFNSYISFIGDCMDRYLLRFNEFIESSRIIYLCLFESLSLVSPLSPSSPSVFPVPILPSSRNRYDYGYMENTIYDFLFINSSSFLRGFNSQSLDPIPRVILSTSSPSYSMGNNNTLSFFNPFLGSVVPVGISYLSPIYFSSGPLSYSISDATTPSPQHLFFSLNYLNLQYLNYLLSLFSSPTPLSSSQTIISSHSQSFVAPSPSFSAAQSSKPFSNPTLSSFPLSYPLTLPPFIPTAIGSAASLGSYTSVESSKGIYSLFLCMENSSLLNNISGLSFAAPFAKSLSPSSLQNNFSGLTASSDPLEIGSLITINIIASDYLSINALNKYSKNVNLADLIAILGSIDFVLGSVDC